MQGGFFMPIVIHIIAHFLDQRADKMRAWRLVYAFRNAHLAGAPLTGIRQNAIYSDALQLQDKRRV